jgi:hypothetical protein
MTKGVGSFRSEYLSPCHSVVPKAQRALAERSGAEESHKRSPIDPWDPSATLRMTGKKYQNDKGKNVNVMTKK